MLYLIFILNSLFQFGSGFLNHPDIHVEPQAVYHSSYILSKVKGHAAPIIFRNNIAQNHIPIFFEYEEMEFGVDDSNNQNEFSAVNSYHFLHVILNSGFENNFKNFRNAHGIPLFILHETYLI